MVPYAAKLFEKKIFLTNVYKLKRFIYIATASH